MSVYIFTGSVASIDNVVSGPFWDTSTSKGTRSMVLTAVCVVVGMLSLLTVLSALSIARDYITSSC